MRDALNLFTYGTLMLPAVMQAVTGRSFADRPAILPDHARYRLKRRVYPGIIASPGDYVAGLLYSDIDKDSLRRLDAFESVLYARREVRVRLTDGRLDDAWAYLVAPEHAHLLTDQPWDLVDFQQRHLAAYLANI